MTIDILTIFPEMFEPLRQSILGKAMRKVLYRAPEMKGLKRVVINEDVIENGAEAMYEVEDASEENSAAGSLPEVES